MKTGALSHVRKETWFTVGRETERGHTSGSIFQLSQKHLRGILDEENGREVEGNYHRPLWGAQ